MSALEALRKHTTIVADSGEFKLFGGGLNPTDATTNPTLILQAASGGGDAEYSSIVDSVVAAHRPEQLSDALTEVSVAFGAEILKRVPGRVSTEVDARLSFDTDATVAKGRDVIARYAARGVDRSRVLLKVAATWEGVRACRILEAEGIHVNMTLVFGALQAAACAEANATLISPFVGRISDYWTGRRAPWASAADDPGVASVRGIFHMFRHRGHRTVVMGASFRNKEQVLELSGCDLLTVSPKLLAELAQMPATAAQLEGPRLHTPPDPQFFVPAEEASVGATEESAFRLALNNDECASFKLAEGIRRFCADITTLESQLATRLLRH